MKDDDALAAAAAVLHGREPERADQQRVHDRAPLLHVTLQSAPVRELNAQPPFQLLQVSVADVVNCECLEVDSVKTGASGAAEERCVDRERDVMVFDTAGGVRQHDCGEPPARIVIPTM